VSGRIAAIAKACASHVEAEAWFAPIVGEGEAAVERRSVGALACVAGIPEVSAAWNNEGCVRVQILDPRRVARLIVVSCV